MRLEGLSPIPHSLHKILTSISSPHFSEFSLRFLYLFGSADDRLFVLGTGWDVVDEELYACAARRSDFRFVIEIPAGEAIEAAQVEALFPRMKSKGSLLITWGQQRPLDQW